jgi:hypothetical protein
MNVSKAFAEAAAKQGQSQWSVAVGTVVAHCPRADPYERNYRIRLLPMVMTHETVVPGTRATCADTVISAPPRLVIQHSMARNSSSFYHASATIPMLITVTFSTPTGDYTRNPVMKVTAISVQFE